MTPRTLTADDMNRMRQCMCCHLTGDSMTVEGGWGRAAADILNGDAITPDHARALAQVQEARELLRKVDSWGIGPSYGEVDGELQWLPDDDIDRAACNAIEAEIAAWLAETAPEEADTP